MIYVKPYSLDNIDSWDALVAKSDTATWFQTSAWLKLWLRHFGGDTYILGIYDGDNLIGIAPFVREHSSVSFLSLTPVLDGELVSDFGDIIILKGREKEVWEAVIEKLRTSNFKLEYIRKESPSLGILKVMGGKVVESDVSPYINLPVTWDEYLLALGRKDRHELKRKIRRLESEGAFKVCHAVPAGRQEGEPADIDEFFRLMSLSNDQKRDFLSKKMRAFFGGIFEIFWPKKMMYLCFMKLNGVNIAATLLFDFRGQILIYNSGFDPAYARLAPGFLLKAFLIKNAIEEKKTRFDFLRGSERYKFDLGATEQTLYTITLTSPL